MPRILAALPLVALLACGPTPPPPPPAVQPKFSSIQQQVFLQSCGTTSCHQGSTPQGGLDLVGPNAYQDLVGASPLNDAAKAAGMLRVDPGHPENSFLLTKLVSPVDAKYGFFMPQVGDPVSAQARGAIETWIKNGAPND